MNPNDRTRIIILEGLDMPDHPPRSIPEIEGDLRAVRGKIRRRIARLGRWNRKSDISWLIADIQGLLNAEIVLTAELDQARTEL